MANNTKRYRLYLKDKGDLTTLISSPEKYLSSLAIERRKKYNIPIAESDVPIPMVYLDTIRKIGGIPIVWSKWMKTVVAETSDSTFVDKALTLPMVDSIKLVCEENNTAPYPINYIYPPRLKCRDKRLPDKYGYAEKQAKMLNLPKLHEKGFRGKGIIIAVIDAGFRNADRMEAFDSIDIRGTYNIVHPDSSVYEEDDHGLKVLSCMAANIPGVMVGTAPEASYYLIKSEDVDTEFPIEEDYWLRAIEYADSLGVDAVTSSLGYFEYDINELSPTKDELYRDIRLITRGGNMAAEKGIMVFCSAGNEGAGDWGRITFPGDSKGVFTVGAVDSDKKRSNFSSFGMVSDTRIKPDGAALGSGCSVIEPDGGQGYANGTSFATPILAGAALCLWQAFPTLSNVELTDILHRYSSEYHRPDNGRGYGIPDIYKAYKNVHKNGIKK